LIEIVWYYVLEETIVSPEIPCFFLERAHVEDIYGSDKNGKERFAHFFLGDTKDMRKYLE
jgi:hypothetical protein